MTRNIQRFASALAALLLTMCALAMPAHAEENFTVVLDRLGRLQTLADQYLARNPGDTSAVDLALTYTRVDGYNAALWQMAAGSHDISFDNYADTQDADLVPLPWTGVLAIPNGQRLDFNHLLAAMQLVSKGLPLAGSWGGDCMELVQAYKGQAADAEGYMALMQTTFNTTGESVFGTADLLADMDAVILGEQLRSDTRLADLLRGYYTADLTDHDRAYTFIALSFGNVDTSRQDSFRELVYNTLIQDTGMQLLLYLNGLWQVDGWQIAPEAEPAMRAACSLMADTLTAAVGGETVSTDSDQRMTTMAGEALVDALNTLGDPEAAAAAQAAQQQGQDDPEDPGPQGLDGWLYGITASLRESFDVRLYRAVLLVIGGVALAGLVTSLALLVLDLRRR